MVVRRCLWSGLVLSLFLLGSTASAQSGYLGDDTCGGCHVDKFATYIEHGHPWMLVRTAGATPPDNLFPHGVALPTLPTNPDGSPVTWDQIEYIYGRFHGMGGGFVFNTGFRNAAGNQQYTCGGCHTTGYDPAGTQLNHLGQPMTGAVGSWALEGIQCEACHGRRGPSGHAFTGGTGEGAKVCDDCHVRTPTDFRMWLNLTGTTAGTFYDRQAEALRHSPHKNMACADCHSPHKTVWFQGEHEDGGVRFAVEHGKGDMCKQCHTTKRIRGAMGEAPFELECVDCHMPYVSVNGSGAAHLFRISTDPTLTKANNVVGDPVNNRVVWKGTETPGEDAVLTLDLVCARCHSNMTLNDMATTAQRIHREPGIVDLTVNNSDDLVIVRQGQEVSVDVDVKGGVKAGSPADWYVCASTSWGWYTWTGATWRPGLFPTVRNYGVVDFPSSAWNGNIYKGNGLLAGWYTFWFGIFPKDDGSAHLDSVPLFILQ